MKMKNFYNFLLFVIISALTFEPCYGQFWSYFSNNYETCNDVWIPGDIEAFRRDLRSHVYGQPLVEDIIANAVSGHLNGDPKKALTLSFHGWPGCGKNYIADFLAESLYKNKKESGFFKYYNARINFPQESLKNKYQELLRKEIKEALQNCPRTLFVFDEVDMMPYKVLDAIHPYIDYHGNVDGVETRKAIFIFLSNKGGNDICEKFLELWKKNIQRDDFNMVHFQNIIRKAAFNEEGGFKHSDNINSHLITYFVPFLPLEKKHVISCIEREFKKKAIHLLNKKNIETVLSHVVFTPQESISGGLFAVSGCKNIDTLVSTIVEQENYRQSQMHKKRDL